MARLGTIETFNLSAALILAKINLKRKRNEKKVIFLQRDHNKKEMEAQALMQKILRVENMNQVILNKVQYAVR